MCFALEGASGMCACMARGRYLKSGDVDMLLLVLGVVARGQLPGK